MGGYYKACPYNRCRICGAKVPVERGSERGGRAFCDYCLAEYADFCTRILLADLMRDRKFREAVKVLCSMAAIFGPVAFEIRNGKISRIPFEPIDPRIVAVEEWE